MSVRTGFAAVCLISLGLLTAACSGAAKPITGPSSPLTRATGPLESLESTTPAPAVSWLKMSPERGAPGSTVSLDVACLDTLGTVNSPVLEISPLRGDPEGHQPWHLFGTAIVRSDAAPGRYRVSVTCGASELSGEFTVELAR